MARVRIVLYEYVLDVPIRIDGKLKFVLKRACVCLRPILRKMLPIVTIIIVTISH